MSVVLLPYLHKYLGAVPGCDLASATNSEDYSMVIDNAQNSQQIYRLIPSLLKQILTFQGPDLSALSNLQDEDVNMALQDIL